MYSMPDIRAMLETAPEVAPVQRTQGLMRRARLELEDQPTYDPNKAILDHIRKYREPIEEEVSTTSAAESSPNPVDTSERPSPRSPEVSLRGLTQQASDLLSDPAFEDKLGELEEKYPGLTRAEIFRTIKGESSFNPTARNPSGATGLFQFMPAVAEELGTSTQAIARMRPVEQLELYDKYLQRWNYNGSVSLGVMQAAPAFANASPDTVVYGKDTAAWRQNPGWRPSNGGDITVASINNYYRKQ